MVDGRESLQQRLRGLFAQELEDGLRSLTHGVLSLERAENDADIDELFRAAHGLKGAAHAVGVSDVVTICHRMESTFAAVRDGELVPDTGVVGELLADIDALGQAAAALTGTAGAQNADRSPSDWEKPDRPAATVTPPTRTGQLAGPTTAPGPSPTPQSQRVPVERIDALLTSAGESLASSQRLTELMTTAHDAAESVEAARRRWHAMEPTGEPTESGRRELDQALDEAATKVTVLAETVRTARRDVGRAASAVAQGAQSLRLQPLADAFEGLHRVVRDIAVAQSKQASFSVHGGGVEVDRAVVAALREPLAHLVRNAVDHGLEPPGERVAAGKPPVGAVTIRAEVRDRLVAVTVTDDGRGVDLQALRAAAQRRGLEVPAEPTDVVFLPGLSTAPTVTAVSGRGVGLDAVRSRLEQIGGAVELATSSGAGTSMTVTVPTTLTTMRVLLTEAAGELVGLPITSLERVASVRAADVRNVEGRRLVTIEGETRQLVSLAGAFGMTAGRADGRDLAVAVLRGQGSLLVDAFVGDVEVVVKPAPRRLRGMPVLLGVALVAGGRAALVVNAPVLLRTTPRSVVEASSQEHSGRHRVLLAEDTMTTRALERSILAAAGYDVLTAVDGQHAWELLQSEEVDVVVSDVDMPRMDGFTLCAAIRRDPDLRELPVLLVTSLGSDADRQRGADAGADAYVVKSDFEQGTLLDTIQRLL